MTRNKFFCSVANLFQSSKNILSGANLKSNRYCDNSVVMATMLLVTTFQDFSPISKSKCLLKPKFGMDSQIFFKSVSKYTHIY